jgi:hypothetical protein
VTQPIFARTFLLIAAFSVAVVAPPAVTAQAPAILVTSRFTDQVLGFSANGQFSGVFAAGGGLDNPVGATYGSDGHLYVSSGNTNQVLRYDGATGAPLGVLANVLAPRQINTGPDGLLYVCSGSTASVLRYTTSGQLLGTFAQSSLISGNTSMTFGPDLDLYVGSVFNNHVVRFDGQTGALLGVFANVGMNGTHDLCFGPDGHLYVTNAFSHTVVRFHGVTGAWLGVFIADPALLNPLGMAWDANGDLLVANQSGDSVRRYDGITGVSLGALVAPASGGLDGPLFVLFARGQSGPLLAAPTPGIVGQHNHLVATGNQAGAAVAIGLGTLAGEVPLPCSGLAAGIANPLVLAVGAADEGGRLLARFNVPAAVQGLPFLFQAFDLSACATSNVLVHAF